MPAIRLTIALNANQSTKAPILIPASAPTDPTASSSIREHVFKSAQSKLRLKKPTRVFVGGSGQELRDEEDWNSNIKDDVVLLVSAGEDYAGAVKESNVHPDANPRCPVEVLASKAAVESFALTQLHTTAHTLPGIVHAIGQPDLHPGTKFPIGAVFASKKWIHPPLVGSDIGCGMALYKTTLHRSQVDGDKGKRVAEQLRGLEGAWRTQAYREEWLLDEEKHSSSAGEQWDASLGTIGAGNHFAEIQVVEELPVTSNWDGRLRENDVVLLVHSGSRGFGGSIFKKHTANTHTSHEECSEDAVEYLKKHDKACEWAKANRDLIALRFLACLEPGNEDWKLGKSDASDADKEGIEMIMAAKEALKDRKMVDICHNNVERVAWPPSSPHLAADDSALDSSLIVATESLKLSDGIPQEYVYLHRKGAAPTHDPDTELPLDILPLPGSRGTPTLMLQPTFSDANSWGLKNGLSLAHGAGRAMSRAKALAMLSHKYKGINLLEPNSADPEGTWVICDEKDLVFEEAPWAYKVVQDVGRDLEDVGAARIVGWCCPRISYKIRNETR